MDEEHRKQRWRLWIIIAGAVLIPVVLLSLHVILNHNGVARRLTALRDAGYPTNLAEWAELHKLPEGAPNAARLYERAFSQFVYPTNDANVPVLGQAALPERGATWSEPMRDAVAQCLQDNQAGLDLLHEAAAIEECWYNWQYLLNMPDFSGFRRCAFLLKLEMLFHAQQDQVDALVPCFESMLSLSKSLRHEPTVIPYLMRMGAVSMSLHGLEWTLNTASSTDRQLQDLNEMLAQTVVSLDLTEVIISRRCEMIELFQEVELWAGYMGQGGVALKFPGAMKTGLLDMLDHTADAVEAMKLSPVERLARFGAIDAKQADLPLWHVISNRSPQTLSGICELDLRLHARIDLARTALAIERYRLATEEVPERLEALVPRYLDAVPIDPFDGRPIRYRRTEPGYLLYSIMEDGHDNGGRTRDEVNKGESYDLCFIVTR